MEGITNDQAHRLAEEVLDIKDFRDYFEVKVKSEPEIPWRSEKDMTMIKNLAKDLEKEWKVDLLLHVT